MGAAQKVRRPIAVALSSGLLLVAAACGGGDSEEPGGTTEEEKSARGPITFVTGKDVSGERQKEIDAWNEEHPDEPVTMEELPDNADQQRAALVQNAQVEGTDYSVIRLDAVWTAEFAANGWVDEISREDFPMDGYIPATIDTVTYFDKQYAVPDATGAGMLYYRTDLLEEVGAEPPTTWDEMKDVCAKVQAKHSDIDCYAGQFQKYEGLTVNFGEAVASAGGRITDEQGQPTVDTPEARAGLDFLLEGFSDGTIPKGAITWQEEQGRQAFQDGKLIFHRNWAYVYSLAEKDDGSSKVNGKFDVAPLPGKDGPGVSMLGGNNLAISAFAENKGTAIDFMKFVSTEEMQKNRLLEASTPGPLASLYNDEELTEVYPYLPTLLEATESAQPRPTVVKYADVTTAIQDSVYAALQGDATPDDALSGLQEKLSGLIE